MAVFPQANKTPGFNGRFPTSYVDAFICWCIHMLMHSYADAFICLMHSYVWCIHMLMHSYVDAFMCWCIHMFDAFICLMYSYVDASYVCRRDSRCLYAWRFICVPWLIHIGAMTHSYVHRRDSCCLYAWRFIYVCHDSFTCLPWLIHMCAMTHLYVRHPPLPPTLSKRLYFQF